MRVASGVRAAAVVGVRELVGQAPDRWSDAAVAAALSLEKQGRRPDSWSTLLDRLDVEFDAVFKNERPSASPDSPADTSR